MTVSTSQSRIAFPGNNVTVLFPVPFPFIQDDYLTVVRTNNATLVATTLILNSAGANGYTVQGAGNQSGSVTVVTPPTGAETLSIFRVIPATQEADFVANDPFPAETFEDSLDKLTMIVGGVVTDTGRALKLFEGDTDGFGRYNANGNRVVGLADGIDPADAATVGQLIGAGSGDFIAAGVGAVTRTMQNKARDVVSVKDFGAVGNGVTDDTAAFVSALAAAQSVFVPQGNYLVNSQILISGTGKELIGAGSKSTRIFTASNFDAILKTAPGSSSCFISDILLDAQATTTRCLSFADGINHRVNDCEFTGSNNSGTAPLVFVSISYSRFEACRFHPLAANLWSMWIDNRADGGLVIGTSIFASNTGFSGRGFWIRRTHAGQPRSEGTKIAGCNVLNTGTSQLLVDSHYGLEVVGTAFEECTGTAIDISDTDRCHIIGGSVGLGAVTTLPCIRLRSSVGKGTTIMGVTFRAGNYAIRAEASGVARIADMTISGCVFDAHDKSCLYLDSVDRCSIVGNVQTGSAFTDGAISTVGTFGAGSYTFSSNSFQGTAAPVWHTGSTYESFGNIGGPTMRARNLQVVAVAATTVTVTHGLVGTPSVIQATPRGTTGTGAWWVSAIGATTFTINWVTSTTVTWSWDASL
jgi:hypothetical protein